MTTIKQTTIDSLSNSVKSNKKRKYEEENEDSSSDDEFENKLKENKNEMDFLIDAKTFEIQDEVFIRALDIFETKKKKRRFLNNFKAFYSNINNEYDRMESLFPQTKKDSNKKYYYGRKKVTKKLEGVRVGVNINIQKANKIIKLLEESDEEE
jgi:hypothetical protein